MKPSSLSSQTTTRRRNGEQSQSRRRRRASPDATSSDDTQVSIVWAVLLLGLIFCLMDVAYMLSYVDTQRTLQEQEAVTTFHEANAATDFDFNINNDLIPLEEDDKNKQKQQQEEEESAQLTFATNTPPNTDDPTHPSYDKGPILKILHDAGIHKISAETLRDLPTWTQVTTLYGDHPRIYGLDQCPVFQTYSDPADHFVSTAGPFNSGTNLMAELLIHNCHNPARMAKYGYRNRGVRWQVPWGKHNPPRDEAFRNSHKTQKDFEVDANDVLPAVTIRDPYVWMGSMCRHPYSAHWAHNKHRPCPNLIPTAQDLFEFPRLKGKNATPVWVKYAHSTDFIRNHTSLAHMWNDWYQEYIKADFPRVIVRYEDLMFFAKETTEAVCKCAGGELDTHHPFKYQVSSAKKGPTAHGDVKLRTGFVDAIIRYGKEDGRLTGFNQESLEYAHQSLDRDLMEFFGYLDPPTVTQTAAAKR